MIGSIAIRVAGVSFRQADVKRCEQGDEVTLVPEPENEHDSNAIKVIVAGEGGDRFIGYIPREQTIAFHIFQHVNAIKRCTIESMGMESRGKNMGVNLSVELEWEKPDAVD